MTPCEVSNSLIDIAAVLGTAGNDLMWGTDYQPFEYFRGMAGNDTIDGRGANDIVDYGNAGRAVNITLAASGKILSLPTTARVELGLAGSIRFETLSLYMAEPRGHTYRQRQRQPPPRAQWKRHD